MLIPDVKSDRNLFSGAAFISMPKPLRIALKGQTRMIEQNIVLPLRMMASDWDKIAENIGLSDKEMKSLNTVLRKLQQNA